MMTPEENADPTLARMRATNQRLAQLLADPHVGDSAWHRDVFRMIARMAVMVGFDRELMKGATDGATEKD